MVDVFDAIPAVLFVLVCIAVYFITKKIQKGKSPISYQSLPSGKKVTLLILYAPALSMVALFVIGAIVSLTYWLFSGDQSGIGAFMGILFSILFSISIVTTPIALVLDHKWRKNAV